MIDLTYEEAVKRGVAHLLPAATYRTDRSAAPDPVPAWQPVRSGDGMNKLERSFRDNVLELAWARGAIDDWRREPIKLRLAGRTFFTPDFLVIERDGHPVFVEVKGFMRDDASVKLKVAAESYPWARWLLVTRDRRAGWIVHEVDSRGIHPRSILVSWIHL